MTTTLPRPARLVTGRTNRPGRFYQEATMARLVQLPCCRQDVKVSTRLSKLRERDRHHTCKTCGKEYRIGTGPAKPR